MVQVKIFYHEWDLNNWLEENDGKINVADIKLAVSASNTRSLMVIYRTDSDLMQLPTFHKIKNENEYFSDYNIALNG